MGEISSERAATAQQACAAFAQLATRAPIPASFRGAVPAVLSVVERRDEHGFDVAARESAVAALVALCACVEGAAETPSRTARSPSSSPPPRSKPTADSI